MPEMPPGPQPPPGPPASRDPSPAAGAPAAGVSDEIRRAAAEALRDWQSTRAVVCDHSQIIDYGAAAEHILAAVSPKVRADERAKVAEEIAAYRCGHQACPGCPCRADMIDLTRGDTDA